jgi:predicted ATP-grasp superfamily ATP-dependent carboligase
MKEMIIELTEKPKSPIIVSGFPGYGFVGTIATEFLIRHLKARQIGRIWSEELMPIAAIHESKIVEPIGVFYSEKYNIIVMHVLSDLRKHEWQVADNILKIADMVNAKEVVCLEAVGDEDITDMKTYYFTTDEAKKKHFQGLGIEPFKEGMIMGVTGAMLLKKPAKVSVFFVEIHAQLGDNEAAAKLIEILDKYLHLNVDYEPLLKAAKELEESLKETVKKGHKAANTAQQYGTDVNYMG